MPQSFAAMYVHIVYSTKHREPRLQEAWAERLHEFTGGILRKRQGSLLAAGGVADHLHLLVSLGREWALADLMRDVKAATSKWVHDHFGDLAFAWQTGYGAFSVSSSSLEAVKEYLARQKEHHQRQSFQEELRELLRRHGLTWDERYIWD